MHHPQNLQGEAIFLLPFIVMRVFKPIIRDVFRISDLEIGEAQAIYGITALLSYFLGGFIADKWEAKGLLSISLILTSFGGIVMTTIPSVLVFKISYALWGVSTIFLFWSALIKATRQWGNENNQGPSFGLLDGGRGLFAAIIALSGAAILSYFFSEESIEVTYADKKITLQYDRMKKDGTFETLSKKERLQVDRLRAKLEKNLGSITDMTRLPGALFIVDTTREHIAVKEAQKLKIPIFAMVDTNSDPRDVDFVIPSNDDASKSIDKILGLVTGALAEGLKERQSEKEGTAANDAKEMEAAVKKAEVADAAVEAAPEAETKATVKEAAPEAPAKSPKEEKKD